MLLRERERGGVSATFIQILKAVVLLGDIALDKSVPTPLHLRSYLRYINHYYILLFISSE